MPPRLVIPLTEILDRLVTAADSAKFPVTINAVPPPFKVELNVTKPEPLPAANVVVEPKVVASPYV